MKKYIVNRKSCIGLIILLAIFFGSYTLCPTYAIESTPSGKTASSSGSLIDKINELKIEVASKVAVLKLQINKKLQNKVYLGKIKSISEDEINLENPKGVRKVYLNKFTIFQNDLKKTPKKPLSMNEIFEEELKDASSSTSLIAALGEVDDKNILNAKKVVKFNNFKGFPKINFLWGQVKKNNFSNIVIENRDQKEVNVIVDQNTEVFEGNTELKLSQVQANRHIAVSGKLNEKDQSFKADLIYIIEGSMLKPNKKL